MGKESGTALISSCGKPLFAFVFQSKTLIWHPERPARVHAIFSYNMFSPILANVLFVINACVDACMVTLLPICNLHGCAWHREVWTVRSLQSKCLSMHVKLPFLLPQFPLLIILWRLMMFSRNHGLLTPWFCEEQEANTRVTLGCVQMKSFEAALEISPSHRVAWRRPCSFDSAVTHCSVTLGAT